MCFDCFLCNLLQSFYRVTKAYRGGKKKNISIGVTSAQILLITLQFLHIPEIFVPHIFKYIFILFT